MPCTALKKSETQHTIRPTQRTKTITHITVLCEASTISVDVTKNTPEALFFPFCIFAAFKNVISVLGKLLMLPDRFTTKHFYVKTLYTEPADLLQICTRIIFA